MSLFRNREARAGGWTPEPIIPPFYGMSVMGAPNPNMESALRISAVWACVRLIADTISMMPLHLYTFADGIRVLAPNGDPKVLTQPSAGMTMPDFLYSLVVSLMLRGNAYAAILGTDSYGRPTQLELRNPDELRVTVDPNTGRLKVCGRTGKEITNLWRMAAYRVPGSPLGLSPIAYGATTLATDAEVQKFALGYFKDALHPAATLTSDQSVTQSDAQSVLERIRSKKDSREPLVLGAGLKFTPLSVSPNESQFIETQKYSVATICRIFGVPPEMVAAEAGNSMTYSNVEQRALDFLTYSIQPWLTRIETAMASWFPGAQHPRFDTSVLLRTDLETRMKSTAIGIASKQLTPEEARSMGELPPLTESQKKELELVPLTVKPTGVPVAAPAGTDPGFHLEDEENPS